MRIIRWFKNQSQVLLRPKGPLIVLLASAAFLSWLPARAIQASPPGNVLHLDVRGLDILLQTDSNLLLIDIRTPAELTGPLGKIPQARNVPLQDLEKNPGQFPREKTLVIICRSGHRSLKAADLLAEHGYVVYSVDGGMRAWRMLHSPAKTSAEGAAPKKPGAAGHTPGAAKPPSRDNENRHPPEKFFDNNMGC
ncbi:MAG: rhodanese-like domain-containing protein [Syntrophobacteraceae bacterium]|nr:rhodanese-like domain-containing protein [Syntrophobacteraceae bacterium]